jgi:glycosyltransferase involved in cell wall biosynthesis
MVNIDISIIIPTYNRLWSLPQTIESCRINNCNVEIIVINDGSTDGTAVWLDQQKDLIVLNQPNWGKCWAVNKGFEIAQGKYIRFLDSDDLVDHRANVEQFKLAELNNADIVVSGYQSFNNEGQTIKKQKWVETDDFVALQLGEGDGSHYSAFLFKREFIQDIPHRPDFAFRDDRLFILEVALKGPEITAHQGTALLHRIAHNDRLQISSNLKQQVQNYQHLNIYKYVLNELSNEGRLTKRRIKASTNALWHLANWIAKDYPDEATKLVKWIYELDPDFEISEIGIIGFLFKNAGVSNTYRLRKFINTLKKR